MGAALLLIMELDPVLCWLWLWWPRPEEPSWIWDFWFGFNSDVVDVVDVVVVNFAFVGFVDADGVTIISGIVADLDFDADDDVDHDERRGGMGKRAQLISEI